MLAMSSTARVVLVGAFSGAFLPRCLSCVQTANTSDGGAASQHAVLACFEESAASLHVCVAKSGYQKATAGKESYVWGSRDRMRRPVMGLACLTRRAEPPKQTTDG